MRVPARLLLATLLLLVVACSSPTRQQHIVANEIAALAPLEQRYEGVVMGFDVKPATTLVVSIDLQTYIGMNDDDVAAMKRDIIQTWRSVWTENHPHEHAIVYVRIIDFIGRKVATLSTHA